MYDLFISCNSKDYSLAREVFEYVEANNFRAFFCEESIRRSGIADFRNEIDEALDAAQHIVVVASSSENISRNYVKAEWGLFVNEKRCGRKSGNVITVMLGEVTIEHLPIALRQFNVLRWNDETKQDLLAYLTQTVQEIFRIDLTTQEIRWGKRPTTHLDLKNIPHENRIDGDKRGNVIRIWKSSFNEGEKGLCMLAARIIRKNTYAAEQAHVNLSNVVIQDNNGEIIHL